MALEFIAFSDGSTPDILTGNGQLSFDVAAGNAILNGQLNVLAGATRATMLGGYQNSLTSVDATGTNAIINGYQHVISAGNLGTTIGGLQNQITASGQANIIAGGVGNIIQSTATQSGVFSSVSSLIDGATTTSAIVSGDSNLINNSTRCSILSGTLHQIVGSNRSSISAGEGNIINGAASEGNHIATGNSNAISSTGSYNTIAGGIGNVISGTAGAALIANGTSNAVSANSAVAFGDSMTVSAASSFGHNSIGSASTLSTAGAVGFYESAGMVVADTVSVQPDATTILLLSSTTKGFRCPVMTTAQRLAISSPTLGLEVFDSDLDAKYIYTSGGWATSPSLYYNNQTVLVDLTGAAGNQTNIPVICERIGNVVTLSFPLFSQPAVAADYINIPGNTTPLPSWTNPPEDIYLPFTVINDNGFLVGSIQLYDNGGARIGKYQTAGVNHVLPINSFDNSGACGYIRNSVTYSVQV